MSLVKAIGLVGKAAAGTAKPAAPGLVKGAVPVTRDGKTFVQMRDVLPEAAKSAAPKAAAKAIQAIKAAKPAKPAAAPKAPAAAKAAAAKPISPKAAKSWADKVNGPYAYQARDAVGRLERSSKHDRNAVVAIARAAGVKLPRGRVNREGAIGAMRSHVDARQAARDADFAKRQADQSLRRPSEYHGNGTITGSNIGDIALIGGLTSLWLSS